MADYINKVILKGRLGKDPELRYLPSGDAVVNISIATKSGQHVEWHQIVAYRQLAERTKAEMALGDLVYIEGEIKTRDMLTADDKENNRRARKVREVIADALHLVEKRNGATNVSEASLEMPSQIGEDGAQEKRNTEIPQYI